MGIILPLLKGIVTLIHHRGFGLIHSHSFWIDVKGLKRALFADLRGLFADL